MSHGRCVRKEAYIMNASRCSVSARASPTETDVLHQRFFNLGDINVRQRLVDSLSIFCLGS